MFDIFAKLLSTIATFLFPVFASYKALKTSDPALLTPWLMYWVVLACVLLVESWTEFILVWVPFYAWIRAGFLLYLIAPQTQGARLLYQTHVHPFLQEHETAIDDFISSAHDRAKTAGLNYIKQVIQLLKEQVLGLPTPQPTPPPPHTSLSYAQSLIARFNIPNSRPAFPAAGSGSAASTATDFYALLAAAVSAATSGSHSVAADSTQAHNLSNSGTLIPPTISGADRISFITTQRERLSTLLSALDREALSLNLDTKPDSSKRVPSMSYDGHSDEHLPRPASAMSGLSKSRSEADFEQIEREEDEDTVMGGSRKMPSYSRQASGSWLPWSWGAAPAAFSHPTALDVNTDGVVGGVVNEKGKSSGVEI